MLGTEAYLVLQSNQHCALNIIEGLIVDVKRESLHNGGQQMASPATYNLISRINQLENVCNEVLDEDGCRIIGS